MGLDFTSFRYPFVTELAEENNDSEGHLEPSSESLKTNVVDATHPILSSAGIKDFINKSIGFSVSDEKTIADEIKPKVFKDMMLSAMKNKFPVEILSVALDLENKLDKRSDASDSDEIVKKMIDFANNLGSTLERQPLNSEVNMAFMLDGVDKVKKIIDLAAEKPNEDSKPVGSKYDEFIFYKKKNGKKIARKNKEVLQYFKRRAPLGNNVFPYLPLRSS